MEDRQATVTLVDTSVWINHFRGRLTPSVMHLRSQVPADDVLVADLVLLELLRGATNDGNAEAIRQRLATFMSVSLGGEAMAVAAARHYRRLRGLGVTVDKSVDLLIGAYCIEHGHALLHDDRDFDPMHRHLGLRVL